MDKDLKAFMGDSPLDKDPVEAPPHPDEQILEFERMIHRSLSSELAGNGLLSVPDRPERNLTMLHVTRSGLGAILSLTARHHYHPLGL